MSIATPEGRINSNGYTSYVQEYTITDNQGNVRVTFDKGSNNAAHILNERHYYPSGLDFLRRNNSAVNHFGFGGKEEYEDPLGWLDFHARMYDPTIARWNAPDPLAEKYFNTSPYAYCLGNPVNYTDPTGMKVRLNALGKIIYVNWTDGNEIIQNGEIVGYMQAGMDYQVDDYLFLHYGITMNGGSSESSFGTQILVRNGVVVGVSNIYNSQLGANVYYRTYRDKMNGMIGKPWDGNQVRSALEELAYSNGNLTCPNWLCWSSFFGDVSSSRASRASGRVTEDYTLLKGYIALISAYYGIRTLVGILRLANAAKEEAEVVQYTKSNLQLGQLMHKVYRIGEEGIKEFRLPSGKRIDFLDNNNGIIYELKPFNPRAMQAGEKQLQMYLQEIKTMPEFQGINWKTVLDTY